MPYGYIIKLDDKVERKHIYLLLTGNSLCY